MNAPEQGTVRDKDGVRGTIEPDSAPGSDRSRVLIRTQAGERVLVPADLLEEQGEDSFYLPVSLEQLRQRAQAADDADFVVPVIQEDLEVRRREVRTGGVRVTKQVSEQEQVVDEPGYREEVDVERVPRNEVLDSPASIRTEGDTLIVPLMEEELVVSKRLVLREEVRITRRRQEVREPKRVTLRQEQATIERLEGEPGQHGEPTPE